MLPPHIGHIIGNHKKAILILLFIVILLIGFLIRFDVFREPSYHYHGDVTRDYLIGHHMVQYGELPLTGPDGNLGATGNSPFYYSLVAATLLLNDDIIFFGFMNVFFQMITLLIVYLLARNMFGTGTALIAAIFFGFAQGIILQSSYPWQPHSMQLFANLSYLLLLLSYLKRSYPFLLGSIFVFLFSLVLHNSVFLLLPLFFLLTLFVLKSQKRSLRYYGGVVFTFIASTAFLYAPVFLYRAQHPSSSPPFTTMVGSVLERSPEVILQNLISRMEIFIQFFAVGSGTLYTFLTLVLGVILFVGTLGYFFYFQKNEHKKIYTAIILFCILEAFFIASFLTYPSWTSFPPRHFTPIFALFVILVAELINTMFSKKLALRVAKIVVVILLVYAFSPNLYTLAENTTSTFFASPIGFFKVPYQPNPAVEAVKKEILAIQREEKRQELDFFDFQAYYHQGIANPWINAIFWVPLERDFNRKFVKVDDTSHRGYRPLTKSIYIFLRCESNGKQVEENRECFESFSREYPDYVLLKKVYSEYHSIYLTKRQNP